MAKNPNPSQLDPGQIVKRAFDESEDRIRVDAEVTAVIPGPVEVAISQVDDSIRIGDGTDLVNTTTVGGQVGLDVNVIGGTITGDLSPSGLRIQGRITTMQITDTAAQLPAVALVSRNALSVTNLSTTDTLYIGFSGAITANRTLGTNAGWEIGPNEGFNLDVKDNIAIWGIAETGKTLTLKVMELA